MRTSAKLNNKALTVAATKLRKLRLETVGGRKERPATTVASAFDRGFSGAGSQEGIEYILSAGIKYYLAEIEAIETLGAKP